MPDLPKQIGKYEVRGLVGKGAMGVVYRAVDPGLARPVAIKTMSAGNSPHEAELRLRFLREGRSAGKLQHPNIITVHELFEENGTAYLVMELLEGASLSSLLRRRKKLGLGQKLAIVDQIAAGLGEAHAEGIVHRDLKPSNVFVLRSGVVKVLDFGVAKVGEGELTKAGTVFGTVEYMAPEQVRGASVSPRADIFSLGIVAYEVLSGRNPFRAETLAASVFKIVSDTPERLSEVPAEVNELVFRALQKNEGERFASLADLRAALSTAVETARIALRPPTLDESDVVVSKDKSDESLVSVEPRVSQWSNVAAQADLLEELYHQGVTAFHEGRYPECIEKMSQVLDAVPVHSMSLHYLALSEEKRRQTDLPPEDREKASAALAAMHAAHRRGDSQAVIETSNALLRIDKESLEARWYRRHAEARSRGAAVGVSQRSGVGSVGPSQGRSFGYLPARRKTAFGAPAAVADPPLGASGGSSGSQGGLWALVGVAAVFLGLVALWLGSFSSPPPAVNASPGKPNPAALPGVTTSPFDEIDDDGTVVLRIPRPATTSLRLDRAIPTSIAAGVPVTIGLFGEGFSEETTVRVASRGGQVRSSTFVSTSQIDVEIEALSGPEALELLLTDAAGGEARISVNVFDSP